MKIEKIQNYNVHQNNEPKPSQVSFAKYRGDLDKRIIETMRDKKVLKRMEALEWLKGEAGGIAITAVGTGLVAPWPIAYNPFVKAPKDATPEEIEDLKKTKKYTAMRQPISAVLAILFQLGALKPIDMFLDKIFNETKYADMVSLSPHVNHSALNSKSYVEKQVKKALKKEGHKKPSFMQIFKDGWKKYKDASEEYTDLFDMRVEQEQGRQVEELAKSFRETGEIRISKKTLDNKTLATLVNQKIDDYIDFATGLKNEPEGMAFYTDRAETLINNEARLRTMFENISGMNEQELDSHLKSLLEKEKDPKVKTIIEEILERTGLEHRQSRVKRTFERLEGIKELCGEAGFSEQLYFERMGARNTELDRIIMGLQKARIADPKQATKESIAESMNKIIETCSFNKDNKLQNSILHDSGTFKTNKEELSKKVYEDVVKKYRKLLKDTYKGRSQIIKIIIGVIITVPITCNVLNWVYPRFMEKFFPDLAHAKKATKEREGK